MRAMKNLPQAYVRAPGNFDIEVWGEAEHLQLNEEKLRSRPAMSGITIDNIDSRDLDDAIDMERVEGGYRFHISISDVGSVVHPGTAVFTEALRRVWTRYLASGNRPMIPRILSEDQLSLLPGQIRPTITVSFTLNDETLDVSDIAIRETALTSRRKMHYGSA